MSGELSRHTNHHSETWSVMKKIYGPNERRVDCACKPEQGIKCMSHFDIDTWLLSSILNNESEALREEAGTEDGS